MGLSSYGVGFLAIEYCYNKQYGKQRMKFRENPRIPRCCRPRLKVVAGIGDAGPQNV